MCVSEFENRVNLQRRVITLINRKLKFSEPLASLSNSCINRWKSKNSKVTDETHQLLLELSNKILFLATKSQEQITDEYAFKSLEAVKMVEELEEHIKKTYFF